MAHWPLSGNHLLSWVPVLAASCTFSWYCIDPVPCLSPGRSCSSGHSKLSQQGLVCSGFYLSLWESLFGSISETPWICGPHSSWNGKTGGEPHNKYDQWEWRHPGVRPGPGRLGKYVGAPGFARHLLLMPGTDTWDSNLWFFLQVGSQAGKHASLLC